MERPQRMREVLSSLAKVAGSGISAGELSRERDRATTLTVLAQLEMEGLAICHEVRRVGQAPLWAITRRGLQTLQKEGRNGGSQEEA